MGRATSGAYIGGRARWLGCGTRRGPPAADYDGDGKTDAAVYRPGGGTGGQALWYARLSGGGVYQASNGGAADVPVPADYNGDLRADPVVFRAANGLWVGPYNGVSGQFQVTLGQSGDVPIPGFYDNNIAADPGVYRPAGGVWLATLSGGGSKRLDQLGPAGDIPIQRRPTLPAAGSPPTNPGVPT